MIQEEEVPPSGLSDTCVSGEGGSHSLWKLEHYDSVVSRLEIAKISLLSGFVHSYMRTVV